MLKVCRSIFLPDFSFTWYSHDTTHQVRIMYPSKHSYLLFGEKSSLRTVISCISIVIGYIAGVDGEINFSLRGTLFGVGASAVGTFYTIYLKRYLSNIIDNRYLLTFYTNFNSCLILPFICVLNGEVPIVWKHRNELTFSFFFWIFVCRWYDADDI